MSEMIASTYEIIREIGSGGAGVVYLANHIRLKKKVILKADKRKITTRPDLLRREVDVLKELRHTYIPQVYDYFAKDDVVYTVIDYIEGESLDKPLKRGEKFSQAQVVAWAKEVLQALDYLHSPIHGSPARGYVHSDIKPANIMRKPDGHICLIDFNIALALGEENAVGCSRGYASPEHYGADFSSGGRVDSGTEMLSGSRVRRTGSRSVLPSLKSFSSESSGKRTVVPDVRSDIYSLGATLYHLLSGKRPNEKAKEVIPLSKKEFSAQIVDIITKAMNPNPDLRYQSAKEMLEALSNLHRNDIRMVRWRRRNKIAYMILSLLLVAGIASTFLGLRRMQVSERWRRLTEDAQNALQEGDSLQTLQDVMQVYDEQNGFLFPKIPPKTQEVLTEALQVYHLADDFDIYRTAELPSEPLDIRIAPDASTAACICLGKLVIIDLNTAVTKYSLATEGSALAEAEYVDADTLVYAGQDGIAAYDLSAGQELWRGEKATGIAVSEDGGTVAAIYKNENYAIIYDTATGKIRRKVDFGKRSQEVVKNDIFINPFDNIFNLNQEGDLLAVSFSDGALLIKDLRGEGRGMEIFDGTVPYTHYEGGFYQQYFAFSATTGKQEESVFSVIDTETAEQTGGFSSEGYYFTKADENGIVVGVDNILVQMDPVSGEQQPLVTTAEKIDQYSCDQSFSMVSAGDRVSFFDKKAHEIGSFERNVSCDLLKLEDKTAVIGSLNSPVIWIAKYENCQDSEIMTYDPEYVHDETRLNSDEKTIMLFSYDKFRICSLDGDVIRDVSIPDADNVYDQQYIRDGTADYLKVIYNDGRIDTYSTLNGDLIASEEAEPPDKTLYEEFETDRFRIESPLHGVPKVYDRDSGKLIAELSDDAYLTYISEIGNYLVAQYMTTDSRFYGYLMNQKCQVLAYLPDLCDVLPDALVFDYPSGSVRKVKVYELAELQEMARQKMEEQQ